MKVFLMKDVPSVGKNGQIVKVSDGYAQNFLFPRKLAVEITPQNEAQFVARLARVEKEVKEAVVKTSQLAERIKQVQLVIKRKLHDGDKLYAAVQAGDIAQALADQGIKVAKNQIELDKAIKNRGLYEVVIRLSSTLRPVCTVKIIGE